MGSFRQEYWSGSPFPTPGDLPDPGIEPTSLVSSALAGRFFTNCATWEAPASRWLVPANALTFSMANENVSMGAFALFYWNIYSDLSSQKTASSSKARPSLIRLCILVFLVVSGLEQGFSQGFLNSYVSRNCLPGHWSDLLRANIPIRQWASCQQVPCLGQLRPWHISEWKSLSRVWLFVTPWTIQSMEFSRPEYWSGSLSLLQGIFPTQGSNRGLLHCRWILYQLNYEGSPHKN